MEMNHENSNNDTVDHVTMSKRQQGYKVHNHTSAAIAWEKHVEKDNDNNNNSKKLPGVILTHLRNQSCHHRKKFLLFMFFRSRSRIWISSNNFWHLQ